MFHSQTAIAYNPAKVPNPPKSYAEVVDWIKANPKRFGYNGVKGGMSGVAFVGVICIGKTGKYDQLAKGPYDKALEADWTKIFKELKDLPCTITQGNNGTLDMLNRGEIDMAPSGWTFVFSPLFVLWKNEGRMDPKMRMALVEPGMPGQPMYVVITSKSANPTSPKVCRVHHQPRAASQSHRGQDGLVPGIDATQVLPNASDKGKAALFGDIPADTYNKFGLSFPLAQYMTISRLLTRKPSKGYFTDLTGLVDLSGLGLGEA